MVQVLVCSACERGNKKPSWFLFWRGRGLGFPLTILCTATLFIWSGLFPFCLCTPCCYSHSPCFVILVLDFAAFKHHIFWCLHSCHTCLVLTSYTPIIVNSTHHVFCWPYFCFWSVCVYSFHPYFLCRAPFFHCSSLFDCSLFFAILILFSAFFFSLHWFMLAPPCILFHICPLF